MNSHEAKVIMVCLYPGFLPHSIYATALMRRSLKKLLRSIAGATLLF
jgi:hypothetical protein